MWAPATPSAPGGVSGVREITTPPSLLPYDSPGSTWNLRANSARSATDASVPKTIRSAVCDSSGRSGWANT